MKKSFLSSILISFIILFFCSCSSNKTAFSEQDSSSLDSTQLPSNSSFPTETSSIDSKNYKSITLSFPNYESGIPSENAAVLETSPFEITLSIPCHWKTYTPKDAEDDFSLMPLFSKIQLLDDNENVVGVIGFNTYEPYDGAEDEPRAIYSQIALGNDYQYNVRDRYDIIETHAEGVTAITDVEYASSVNGGTPKRNTGILSYNRSKNVYIAIELFTDSVDLEQTESIAQSILWENS